MICTTCGRDNPGHLTFCQECGQRLAPRVVPPTPPVGLSPPHAQGGGASPLAATALAPTPPMPPTAPPAPVPPPSIRQRPAAPQVSFAPRADPVLEPPPTMACPLCGSSNQRGLRFCVTCGQLLAPSSAPPAARGPTGTVDLNRTVPGETPKFDSAPPPAPAPAAGGLIAPGRVVELGASAPVAMQRLCPRCRGASDQGAQFCRFCGGSLADAPAVSLQPSPNPIAATPPPPPVVAPAPRPPPVPAHAHAHGGLPAPAHAPAAVAPSVSRARLVLIARDGGEGPSYPLGESTDIGRTEGNIVIAEDRYISPRHARIAVRGGAFFVRDLESTNGLFVRIPFPRSASGAGPQDRPQDHGNMTESEQVLADQDLFLVGQQVLRFEVVKHAEEGFGVASENGTLLFGTPAAPRYARLSQRTVEGVVRDIFHLRKAETVIGRESGDIVFTDDPFLSRRHAVLRVHAVASASTSRRFTLADLGSSNGTFLQVREEVRLRHGDHFRIGQQLFRFDT